MPDNIEVISKLYYSLTKVVEMLKVLAIAGHNPKASQSTSDSDKREPLV